MADMSLLTTFAPEVYAQRLKRAQEITKAAGIDAVVVATGEDFFYLVGSTLSSHERLTALIIPAEGTPQLFAPGTDILDLNLSPVPQLDVQVHGWNDGDDIYRSEEHTSELQSRGHLVCRLLLEKKNKNIQ